MARQNLFFKGLTGNQKYLSVTLQQAQALQQKLQEFFNTFGEVRNLKLLQKNFDSDEDSSNILLLGCGFVSFQTLEAAQKAKHEVG